MTGFHAVGEGLAEPAASPYPGLLIRSLIDEISFTQAWRSLCVIARQDSRSQWKW